MLINSLEGGGAEKVMARLAGDLARRFPEVEIRLALLDDLPAAQDPGNGVEIVQLDSRGSFRRSIAQVRDLVAAWRPGVVLSFLTRANCAAILARERAEFRCIVSERVNTTSHLGGGLRGWLLRAVVARLYRRADAVIAVSRGVRDELQKRYGVPEPRLHVIYNPVDASDIAEKACAKVPGLDLPEDCFVSIGRLVPNKGFDVLLRAFARHDNAARTLVILGEGPERKRLQALARELGIDGRVLLPGYLDNPHPVLRRADAYVSASRSEGFPNALVEAMVLGLPVLATDCASGPAEILAERLTGRTRGLEAVRWGLLAEVDDVAAITAGMDALNDVETRRDLGRRARERSAMFAAGPVVEAYASVLGLDCGGKARWDAG